MNEATHFANFKGKHKHGMQVARHIESHASQSNGTGAAKGLQEIKHLPVQLPWRMRVRGWLKRGWLLMSPAKQDGRYSISQPLALVIIGSLCTIGAAGWWRSADKIQEQHDEIIRLQTKLENEQNKNIDQDSKIDQARNYATIADKNQARLEGKFDQFALQYGIRNAGKPQNGQ